MVLPDNVYNENKWEFDLSNLLNITTSMATMKGLTVSDRLDRQGMRAVMAAKLGGVSPRQ